MLADSGFSPSVKMKMLNNLEYLKSILRYDSLTGAFYWKCTKGSRATVGGRAGTINNHYARVCIDKQFYYLHRLALEFSGVCTEGLFIDHIDGNKTNNKLENLRLCTKPQNAQNIKKASVDSKSGVLGVWYEERRDKWASQIKYGTTRKWIGYFSTLEEAGEAYAKAKREHHEFCTT